MSSDESEMEDAKEKCELAVVKDITMDADVWKRLPDALRTRILEHCSVPDLCRFRVVCHAWNDLIRDPTFALEARHQGKYIFKAPDEVGPGCGKTDAEIRNLLRNCWEIYDPNRQKFWSISIGFLYDAVLPDPRVQDRFAYRNVWEVCRIIAADKGFVCVLWSSDPGSDWSACTIMQVVNPVTRSVIRIPPFHANNRYIYEAGEMTVADDHSSFTLYVDYDNYVSGDSMMRFDSQKGEWREISLPGTLKPFQMLHMNEMLYARFRRGDMHQLFALNKTRNEWMNTGMELPTAIVVVPKLVTTLGRLFFVEFDRTAMLVISEIDIPSVKFNLVTRNNNIKLLGLLDSTLEGRSFQSTGVNKVVLGCEVLRCDNYIVFTSITGGSIAYDLVKEVWSDWSWNRGTMNQLNIIKNEVFGVAMTLTLNLPLPSVRQ